MVMRTKMEMVAMMMVIVMVVVVAVMMTTMMNKVKVEMNMVMCGSS